MLRGIDCGRRGMCGHLYVPPQLLEEFRRHACAFAPHRANGHHPCKRQSGAGIAVMGVFNLVRFRSIPGSAKDIGSVFLAMAIGLATGMGFIGLAVLFTIIVAIVNVVYVCTPFGKPAEPGKRLCVSVPEDLEFDGMFDNVLGRFTESHELVEIRTTNMGSLYQLEYEIRMREPGLEKRMIDEMRTMNGNLKITLGRAPMAKEVL